MTHQEFIQKIGLSKNEYEIKNGWLVVEGNLNYSYNHLTSLPDNLKVGGYLYCSYNQLTSLPDNLKVEGHFYCDYNQLTSLPDNLKVGGNLDCSNNQLTSLPDNLKVGGYLNCYNNQLTSLPNNLKVGGHLYCFNNQLTSLPDNLKVGGNIAFWNNVFMEKSLVRKALNNKITAMEILQQTNQEIKMTLLKVYGWNKLIKELKPKILDEKILLIDSQPLKHRVLEVNQNGWIGRFLEYICPSDGEKGLLRVDHRMDSTRSVEGAREYGFIPLLRFLGGDKLVFGKET